jgi:hypothetical protein
MKIVLNQLPARTAVTFPASLWPIVSASSSLVRFGSRVFATTGLGASS